MNELEKFEICMKREYRQLTSKQQDALVHLYFVLMRGLDRVEVEDTFKKIEVFV